MAMTRSIVRIVGFAGVGLLSTTLVLTGPGSAEAPECWVDVINDLEPAGAGVTAVADREPPATADEAVERGLRDVEADGAESRRRGDRESVSADPQVFAARRALYAGARPGTDQASGTSEWVWHDEGRARGVLVMVQAQGGWRVVEEHFLVSEGPCGA